MTSTDVILLRLDTEFYSNAISSITHSQDQKSVPGSATMAYYYKPLTYNSQIAGYLIRKFPEKWMTIDAASKEAVLVTNDNDILVKGTNTPDLRKSVRTIQKAFDARAIMERKSRL